MWLMNATGTITVTPNNTASAANYNTNIVYQYCINRCTMQQLERGIGTATGLPAGVTAAFASNTITISWYTNCIGNIQL
jgi:hypothetical protein